VEKVLDYPKAWPYLQSLDQRSKIEEEEPEVAYRTAGDADINT